jgi:hypothetical protein
MGGGSAFLAFICWVSPTMARLAFGTVLLLVPYVGLFFFPVFSPVGLMSCLSGACGLALLLHTVKVIDKRKRERRRNSARDGENLPDAGPDG